MGVHDVYRIANRAVALARKTLGHFRAHGAGPTIRRVARALTTDLDSTLGWRERAGGAQAPLVISSANDGLAELPPLLAGATLSQEISAPVEGVYDLEVFFAAGGAGPSGHIVLAGKDGSLLHREQLRSGRRGRDGRYRLRLESEVSIPAAAGGLRIDIEVGPGERPSVAPLLNPAASIGALRLSHRQPQKTEQLPGGLALRILARGSRTTIQYHRRPVAAEFVGQAGTSPTLYVIGDGAPQLQSSNGPPMMVRRIDARGCLASQLHAGQDALLLTNLLAGDAARELVRFAQSAYVPVINAAPPPRGQALEGRALADCRQLLAWSDAVLVRDDEVPDVDARAPVLRIEGSASVVGAIAEWLPQYRKRILPRVSIVCVLCGFPRHLETVLDSYFGQIYSGELEYVFVDAGGAGDAIGIAEKLFERARATGVFARTSALKVVRIEGNASTCIARNAAISHVSGDLVVVADTDCMLCRTFVARHAEAHSYGDCDVVIGPQVAGSNGGDPLARLDELEQDPRLIAGQAQRRDVINPHSFLNCVAGNFSLRRDFVQEDLYDPQFSAAAGVDGQSGWEDVEMGYRLFRRGARIKHVGDAFGVRLGGLPSMPATETAIDSMRHFRRLLEKHPDIALEARRWVLSTCRGIRESCERFGQPVNDDMRYIEHALGEHAAKVRSPAPRPSRRPLRVLTYRWHVPHQYELYKLPHEFTLLGDLDSPMTNHWEYRHRPLPDNVRFRSRRGLRLGDYDLAILHFDENVLSYENTHGVLGPDWGAAFRWFAKNVDLPKVAICHGTPQFYGQYDFDYDGPDLMQTIEPARKKLVEYAGDMLVVCNSYQAQREWQFRRSRVIWHGFDPTEFPPATYERGILSPLGPAVISRPHYRGYFLHRKVLDGFPEAFAPSMLHVPDPSPLYEGNHYAIWKYRNYVDEIRRYSVYFNPTVRSPMPRARGEPMMCGLVTVNANNHDVDLFIRNGVNGFYSNDAE